MSDFTDAQASEFWLNIPSPPAGAKVRDAGAKAIDHLTEAGWEIKPPPEPAPTYPGTDREVQVGDVVKCRYCDDYEFTDVPYHLITEVVGDEDARTALADDQFEYSLVTEIEELTFIGRPGEAAKVGDKVLVVEQSTTVLHPGDGGAEVGEVVVVERGDGGVLVLNGRFYAAKRYVIVERAPKPRFYVREVKDGGAAYVLDRTVSSLPGDTNRHRHVALFTTIHPNPVPRAHAEADRLNAEVSA